VDLSIIIPSYNEGNNVFMITHRIEQALATIHLEYEIWFIDDSRDNTPQLLNQLADQNHHVHFVHRTETRGLGTAVVEGFQRSAGKNIIVMDADLQHPPELLPEIYLALQTHDLVIPSRFIDGGSDGGLNLFRKLVSLVARKIGQFGIKKFRNISDCTSGYFGLQRKVIQNVKLNPSSWKILMEILVKGHYQSCKEIPYHFVQRDVGESKMSVKEQWNYLRHLVQLIWQSPADRRFYLFCFVGVLGLFVNLVIFNLLLDVKLYPLYASVLASLLSMVHNFIWHDFVTWNHHPNTSNWKRILRFPKFLVVSLIGIGITVLFVHIALVMKLSPMLGQISGIILGVFWNFFANHHWTWKTKAGDPSLRSG